jgi:DNA-directed RNA polymerase specialized sigma24 family protein
MTREQYGQAYQDGRVHTLKFLLSRGIPKDAAADFAQSAWARGWERRDQLRDESLLVTWVNTIALNLFRKTLRQEVRHEVLVDAPHPTPAMNWAAIDLAQILTKCRDRDRALLQAQLEGVTPKELSQRTGGTATAARLRFYRARHAALMAAQAGRNRPAGGGLELRAA